MQHQWAGELRRWAQNTFLDDDGDKYTGKELNELEDRAITHYNAGFTDKSEIKKVMKLEDKLKKGMFADLPEQEKKDESSRVAEAVGKIARDIDPGKLSDKEYRAGKLQEMRAGIRKQKRGLSDDEVNASAQMAMNLIMQYYKKL